MIDDRSTLDEIILRTIELRKLQQALRGESDEADTTPVFPPSYRYGRRRSNHGAW